MGRGVNGSFSTMILYHRFKSEIPDLPHHTCNGVVSHRAPCPLGPCQPHTQKQMQTKCAHDLCAHTCISLMWWAAFHMFIFTFKSRSRCRWHTHLLNLSYFDHGKCVNTPIGAPSLEKNGVEVWYCWSKSVSYTDVQLLLAARGVLRFELDRVCRSNLKTPTHLLGWFWQKRVPIFKDFSWKLGPFFKNFTIFGGFGMRKPENLGSVRKADPCLRFFW